MLFLMWIIPFLSLQSRLKGDIIKRLIFFCWRYKKFKSVFFVVGLMTLKLYKLLTVVRLKFNQFLIASFWKLPNKSENPYWNPFHNLSSFTAWSISPRSPDPGSGSATLMVICHSSRRLSFYSYVFCGVGLTLIRMLPDLILSASWGPSEVIESNILTTHSLTQNMSIHLYWMNALSCNNRIMRNLNKFLFSLNEL